jgi:flagellar assembly factor FliW
MPRVQTKCFGEMEYDPSAVFEFPYGVPGFECEHAFLFLQRPGTHPLMFMQSLSSREVCFILLPILAADPHYKLRLSAEERAALRLPRGRQPRLGKDILCAALVCAADERRAQPTVNLLAPILVNLKERIGIQAILTESGYSHQHPLAPTPGPSELALCW